ncbi:GMC family oxidoreductase [Dermacoccus sp. PAMC28757]|uniref:GMC family oxidoreductase n=1 Tax=Dermacoccus sp. PAMC28757 TaxID=2762331 RepID=UPI00164D10EC|nr:GMC family oxidoreductase [Dermacoccus sp. PAMC28757]QNK54016.1 GMC family oxidoreductase [Dermacoccus sp. PAMC28757]
MSGFDHDVVVIGSGFGGSVAALRLAEKNYDVLVYEAGPRREDEDFATSSWDVRNYLWAPALKCYGVQRIHKIPDAVILAGAGVGGGSLNYANTLYVPPQPFFADKQWSHITDWSAELMPHYETAKKMLGVVESNPCEGPVEQLMRGVAADLGVSETFRKTPVGVFFGESGKRVADPYFGGEGPERTGCTECGNCMVGCRVGAKNTLAKNYLPLAERSGARIEPMRTVVDLEPLGPNGDEGWRITTEATGAWVRKNRRTVTAQHVVMAAGTWGTQSLLHSLQADGKLPRLSRTLGHLTRTNSEELGGAAATQLPEGVDLTHGVAITSSFHVDETTHVENVRYGRGSNAMGLFSTLLIPGDVGNRVVEFVKQFARRPVMLTKAVVPKGWSERTIIALVMQTVDNSLIVSPKKTRRGWKLTSRQGHGEPNPTWIPGGHKAIRGMADRLERVSGKEAIAGGTWNELFDVPMTAHFLGGAPISDGPETGVIDAYQRVHGYPTMSIVDGTAVSANLGVNPSLTITAQAERAFSLWPAKGERDERPAQGEAYVRLEREPNRVPGQPVVLGMPTVARTPAT